MSSPRGRKEKELVFNGYRVQNEKVLVICCKTKQIHLTPLNFTLKNSEDVKFIFFNNVVYMGEEKEVGSLCFCPSRADGVLEGSS